MIQYSRAVCKDEKKVVIMNFLRYAVSTFYHITGGVCVTEYRLAVPADEENILDFINMVFSQAHEPHDFARLLPKVYGHAGFSQYHWVAARDGRVRATVALLPLELRIDAHCALKVGFVGSVSSHPAERGAGHMRALMRLAVETAEAQGYDFLALGGQRQRYGYFGFERGGSSLRFTINNANIHHTMDHVNESSVNIRRITAAEDPALRAMAEIGSRQMMTCVRPGERFFDIMRSWEGQLYALEDMRARGMVMGYLYALGDDILELALNDECRVRETLKSWMNGRRKARVSVPVHNRVRANFIKSFAESYTIEDAHMVRIFNWRHTLESLLNFKAGYQPLCDGQLVFEVEGAGRYKIRVCEHEATVTDTQETPDIVFSQQHAVEFFFSPFTDLMTSSPMLRSWLPVPLCIPEADQF